MELAGGITPEDLNLFLQEADEQLQLLDEDLVRLEKESGDSELMQEIFRAAHTLKGSSAMIGHQRLSELAHAMENVLDNVRKKLLAVTPKIIDALLHGLDVMRLLRQELVNPNAPETNIKANLTELAEARERNASPAVKAPFPETSLTLNDEQTATMEKALQEGRQGYRIKVLVKKDCDWASVRCFQVIQGLLPIVDIVGSKPTQQEIEQGNASDLLYMIGMSLNMVGLSSKTSDDIQKALANIPDLEGIEVKEFKERQNTAPIQAETGDNIAGKKEDAKQNQTIRVDVGRLDTLMEQVGELVINRNQISQLGRILADKYGNDDDIHNLGNTITDIAKIISNLQQDVMSVRLQPIEIVFSTLPRLVRDLSRKMAKKIEFRIEGQETEVDRSIIEHLRDPLLHLLRNSVDHGIETPEERTAAGKPETGTVTLSAFQSQDNIIIRLKDDGKGIDPAVLRQTAIKKGVGSPEDIAKMSDEEVINLIFASGFSTAKKVTDVSGRGVGLDVVRTNVEVMNGSVSVASEPGKGTTFTLALPLTLAIIPALLVKTGQTTCAVPLSSIIETSRLEEKDVRTISGREVTMFRGNILPLLRMDEAFGWERVENKKASENYVVVVRYAGTQVGFIVDTLMEQQELVLKSLDEFVGGNNSFSGASIMGDGTVVLILDVASLIKSVVTERQINRKSSPIR
jgi:two-component system, chemotaxis family, sensor kinase CheA